MANFIENPHNSPLQPSYLNPSSSNRAQTPLKLEIANSFQERDLQAIEETCSNFEEICKAHFSHRIPTHGF